MFSFLGLRKDSKRPTSEKEADGGFVVIGETVDEQRRKMQTVNIGQPSTNVVVQPPKTSCPYPAQPTDTPRAAAPPAGAAEAVSTVPDLLGDVPFTLAPHVQAVQAGFALLPDVLLFRDINYKLASFQYDFTLENSVLHNA
ncbi:UBAP1-MVB12-associated (UMA)-domain containing protein 1 [Brachionichthys hirsutus]|uniref:UBAP1-MVB12-associated (UMA)-domain containing protein 1 n=1 Tax=Brachionichthys hirsutus TaxID=412623 RepID=UPI0036045E38